MNQDSPFILANKNILITGASSGIGRTVAILASVLGARCVLSGRSEVRLNETLEHLSGQGHVIVALPLIKGQNYKLIEAAVCSAAPLDGFVHCAGIEKTLSFRITELQDLDEIMSVNFTAFWELTQTLLKRKNHGTHLSVVAISSVAANGVPCKAAYAASKGALVSLVKSLAAEYAKDNIRFNCVSPGYVNTPMLDRIKQLYNNTDKFNEAIACKHPLGIGTPQDVANAIVYLLSDASKWVTGSVLDVSGGYNVR